MIAELILLGKLLGKTDLSKSTPSLVTRRPTFFGRDKQVITRPTISKPPTKTGPALGLKKYF